MTTRRKEQKLQKPQPDNPLEPAISTEKRPPQNQRKEKLSDYLLDVSKYILTGVVITSLFNDVASKIIIYIIGLAAVFSTLWLGLRLTSKRKD